MRPIATLIMCLSIVAPTYADVLRVDENASSGGDGSSWGNAFNSLTQALAVASSGDQIWVARGSYVPDAPTGRDATFTVPLGVQVYGGFTAGMTDLSQRDPQDNLTELSGGGTIYTIVTMTGNNTILDGFTISKGLADGTGSPLRNRGAGVYAEDAVVTLRNNIFIQNESNLGGAAVHLAGTTGAASTIEDCLFIENIGDHAIEARVDSLIRDCDVRDNDAGAISLFGSTAIHSVIDCTIEDNTGGAATVQVGTGISSFTEIDGCVIEGNVATIGGVRYSGNGRHEIRSSFLLGNDVTIPAAGCGGVIDNLNGPGDMLSIENTVFTGNIGGQGAALIKESPADLFIIGSTIVGNSSQGFGAGISVNDGTVELWNTIIYGNMSGVGINDERVSVFAPVGFMGIDADRSIIQYLGVATFPVINATNSTSGDPMFVDADGPNDTFGDADDNVRLQPGSPAIDAGNNLYAGPFIFADAYGQTRFRDDTGTPDTGVDGGLPPIVDIGAAEFQGTTPGDCVADTNGDGLLSPADFNAWIIAFNTQSTACDQNGDGLCTPADFNAWIINFNAGC